MPDGSRGGGEDHKSSQGVMAIVGRLKKLQLGRVALGYGIGLAGALLFVFFKLPLPWFLGALTVCLVAAVLNAPFTSPRFMSIPVRAVLGVAIGAAFSPAMLDNIIGMIGSLLMLVPYMVVIIGGGMVFFQRIARFDAPTAFFCAVPGGLTDMVTMATDAGASARTVTLVQATRILLIVFLLPFWLQLADGQGLGGATLPGSSLVELGILDGLVLVGLGLFGWLLALRVGLAGAPLIGPMILSGIVHAAGLTAAKVPVEIMTLAQVTLGIILGAQFRGVTWKEFSTTLAWGSIFAVILVIVTGFVAIGVSSLTGFDSTSVLLAYAPGGQAEMNLLAYILGLDVAFTALHHLVRLAIVIFGAQIVFATRKDWRGDG